MNTKDRIIIDRMIALVDNESTWIIQYKKDNPHIVQNRNCWQNVNAHMGKRLFVPMGYEMTMEEAIEEYGTKWQIPLNVKIIKQ
jgi:hypothetical protein